MIRIVVNEIMTFSTKPGRKHLKMIASKIVNEYPDSFQDKLEGAVVGRGYESVLAQLECRVGNIGRVGKVPLAAVKDSAEVCSDTCSSKTKNCKYGTDWQPELPEGEDASTQNAKMEEMKEMHLHKDWEVSAVNKLLEETYPTLRSIINGNHPLMDIKEDWPFLFEPFGMFAHFNRLVGIHLQDKIIQAFDSHVPRLYTFLCTKQNVKNIRVAFAQIEKAKKAKGTSEPEVLGILYLITAYLGEDITTLVRNEELIY
ncbi:uncharacterized protein LOC117110080 [Anneissia japonica]|uniref:uncharacterized protein LOC117110080 n=1 Tax=Anneissia japonica TaxID=1529436 RepID=UPI0014254F05|nr:uncharacterized protein LOC117110080 [Anneissia japonica]